MGASEKIKKQFLLWKSTVELTSKSREKGLRRRGLENLHNSARGDGEG